MIKWNGLRFLLSGIMFISTGLMSVVGNDTIPLARIEFTGSHPDYAIFYQAIFDLPDKPDFNAYVRGLEGMKYLQAQNKLYNDSILVIIDYSKPSNRKRLWAVDIKNQELLHSALVAHGRNSGLITPDKFSNTVHSNMSSQGFFITGETYYGKHGYSLRLDGIEPGINDNARSRAIVIHSADYATVDFVRQYGRLGRSFGCPALPPSKSRDIIDTIKNGACLYIYANDQEYAAKSKVLKPQNRM